MFIQHNQEKANLIDSFLPSYTILYDDEKGIIWFFHNVGTILGSSKNTIKLVHTSHPRKRGHSPTITQATLWFNILHKTMTCDHHRSIGGGWAIPSPVELKYGKSAQVLNFYHQNVVN